MPRTLSVEEYKELGKRYYARKDYEKALNAFTEGINASVKHDLQLYDYRAATYDKLEKHQNALGDSRSMIKINEKDPRGYLRAGQLLLKQDKKEQALQIYTRGLRHVPAVNAQQKLLHEVHKKLNLELCPPKAVDPLTQLPIEIVEMILGYLKFHEIVRCLRVSREWKNFLSNTPSLWTKIDLSHALTKKSGVVAPNFLMKCAKMAQFKVTHVRIANCHRGSLNQFLGKWSGSIEKLVLDKTALGDDSILTVVQKPRNLKTLIIHSPLSMTIKDFFTLVKERESLQEFRSKVTFLDGPRLARLNLIPHEAMKVLHLLKMLFVWLRNLVDLHVTMDRSVRWEQSSLSRFSDRAHPIRVLEMFTKLEVLKYHAPDATSWFGLAPSIRTVDVDVDNQWPLRLPLGFRPHPTSQDSSAWPALEHLAIHRYFHRLHVHRLEIPVPAPGGDERSEPTYTFLKSLRIGVDKAEHMNIAEIAEMLRMPRLRDLEELGIAILHEEPVSDEFLTNFHKFRRLRKIELRMTGITGVGIKKLVTELKDSLESLTLEACHDVGHDAVAWVGRQGVAVKMIEKKASATGRFL